MERLSPGLAERFAEDTVRSGYGLPARYADDGNGAADGCCHGADGIVSHNLFRIIKTPYFDCTNHGICAFIASKVRRIHEKNKIKPSILIKHLQILHKSCNFVPKFSINSSIITLFSRCLTIY